MEEKSQTWCLFFSDDLFIFGLTMIVFVEDVCFIWSRLLEGKSE